MDDGFLSLAVQLQERWVGSHGSGRLENRDHFDATRFDRVLASIWERRVALEEMPSTPIPAAPVISTHTSAAREELLTAVGTARHLRHYFQFKKAFQSLEQLNSGDQVIALEQAKICFEQGDRWGLLRVSEKAIAAAAEIGHNADNDAACTVFSLYLSISRINLFSEEVMVRTEAEARRLVDKWVPNEVEGAFWSEVQVLIQLLYYTVALRICEENVLDNSTTKTIRSSAKKRLLALQRRLQSSSRIDEAFDVLVLMVELEVLAGRALTDALDSFLCLDGTEPRHIGNVRFRLGKEYLMQNRHDWFVQWDLAEAAYRQCDHKLGLHELSVFRSSFQSWNSIHVFEAFDAFLQCGYYVKQAGIAHLVVLQSGVGDEATSVLSRLTLDIRSQALPSLDALSEMFEVMIQRGEQLNAIVETCLSLLAEYRGESDRTVQARFLLSGLLWMAFEKLHYAAKAVYYADIHLTESEQFFGYNETVSAFASTYAQLSRLHILQLDSMSERKGALDDLRCRLTAWVKQDLDAGYLINAYDKQTRLWDLLHIETHFNPTIHLTAGPFLEELNDIETRFSAAAGDESWMVLCNIRLLRAAFSESIEDFQGSLDSYRNAASLLDQQEGDYTNVQATICVILARLSFKVYTISGKVDDKLLDMADIFVDQAFTAFQELADLDGLFWCSSWQAELCLARGRHTGILEYFKQGLACVQDARQVSEEQRHELSGLSGAQGMETKCAFTEGFFITPISNPSSRDLYHIGVDLALALGDSAVLWELVEGAKAKGLAEMLGLTTTIPAKLLHELSADPEAVALWNEAETLGRRIIDLPPQARRSARAELSQLRASMRNISAFRDILALQNGDPIPMEELLDVFHSTMEDKMTFVHWVTHRGNSDDDETGILLVIVQVDKEGLTTPHIRNIPREVITLEKVTNWKSTYLDTTSLQDEELMDEALVLLTPLVDPLGDLTSPGDLLVFCPTGVLHSLPIHALTLAGQILLHRNPIIYSHSISILRQCSSRAAQGKGRGALQNAAIFGNPTGDRPQSEESAKELSQVLHMASVVIGPQATAEKFTESIRQASLIHYHGHASEDTGNPLERSLVFADHDYLTARDVFNLHFEHAPHITLIACASAEQHISTGNEPLGILPAFLVAGAASIVGTLWPLRDTDGARFSREFYRPFVKKSSSGSDDPSLSQMVDLAMTLQRASLSIHSQQDTRAPYYWAAFVLHGAWFLWI